jgi:hypothetical protein
MSGVGGRARLPGDGLLGLAPAHLSHELRTPLNAILGNTELLLEGSVGPLSSQARACLADIQAAGQRLLRQVQVLLDLCYARRRPEIVNDPPTDLIALLCAAHAAAPALNVGPTLEVVPAGAGYVVHGDAAWLNTLAVALIEAYRGDGERKGRLRVTVVGPAAPTSDGRLSLWWPSFDPEQVATLPVALIDAIVDLHGGDVGLTGDGLQLDWPGARLVQVPTPAAGVARERR